MGVFLLFIIALLILRNFYIQQTARKKSDKLLLNILPEEVVEELKEHGFAKAKLFDSVTVLFTDFKNFSILAEKLSAEKLVAELNICFTAFDKIIEKYGIEKIKTVGDAYLAVSGLPTSKVDHALIMAKAAIEIREFMAQRLIELKDQTFEVRIGINSGSVVAGIVGMNKFAYDIWGDTVNVAARMEQNCIPGKINISETTYLEIKNYASCTFRGMINAKNKGDINMYFLNEIIDSRN